MLRGLLAQLEQRALLELVVLVGLLVFQESVALAEQLALLELAEFLEPKRPTIRLLRILQHQPIQITDMFLPHIM